MFGCEPKQPVDFLLGTDAAVEITEDWVQEHQERLKTAHNHVRQQIAIKAELRNHVNNDQVVDTGFEMGELVYLKNRQVRGRNKIQDHWDNCIHRVVRRPEDKGVVYSVVPVDGEGPARQVHRTEMRKALVPEEAPAHESSASTSPAISLTSDDESEEEA